MANLKLLGAVSGYTEIAAASNAVPTTFTLPTQDGTAGQVLSTNGNGQLSFVTSGGSYTLPTASTTVLGGVRVDGTTITINGSGIISSASAYTLPAATASVRGGIKVGSGLTITGDVLSVTGGGGGGGAATTLLAAGSQREATVDTADNGTPYSIACRDMDGNLNAVLFQGEATSAQFADLAEKYIGDAVYESGTVLEFGGAKEVTIAAAESKRIAGVVSTNPGFIMNNNLECSVTQGERTVMLALVGRVPCKVKGVVKKGDLLVSAGGGFAKVSTMPAMGSVIGKALDEHDGNGDGIIEVVVGRL